MALRSLKASLRWSEAREPVWHFPLLSRPRYRVSLSLVEKILTKEHLHLALRRSKECLKQVVAKELMKLEAEVVLEVEVVETLEELVEVLELEEAEVELELQGQKW